MSIQLLKTLIAISDEGSFRAAAEIIGVSPAAVGQQMKALEAQFGLSLFEREGRVPRLNTSGNALIPKAKAVVAAYDALVPEIVGISGYAGELTLGAVPSAISGLIPQATRRLIDTVPDLHVRVVPGLSDELQVQLERGAIDAAVLSPMAGVDDGFEWYPYAEEELVLLTAPDAEGDDAKKLIRLGPYIRHTRRSPVGILADAWLRDNGIVVRSAMEMESLATLTAMVAHGFGVSIVPNICVPDPVFASLRKVPLGSAKRARVMGVLTRKDCSKMRLVELLLKEIKSTIESAGSK
ncbi:MAG: LysR family transcriptional regulator [Boseongicola sp.]